MLSDELLAHHGFQGSLSVGSLQKVTFQRGLLPVRIKKVPAKPGVYLVVIPPGYEFSLRDNVHRGKHLHLTAGQKANRWVPDTDIIYIGETGGPGKKATLQVRIQKLIRHSLGKTPNHKGGEDIWLLNKDDTFLLYWKECGSPRAVEKQLIMEFKSQHQMLPFGNRQN